MRIVISPKANQEIKEAVYYLEVEQEGLGERFNLLVKQAIYELLAFYKHQVRYNHIRTKRVAPFRYLIHYRVNERKQIIIIARVLHTRRRSKLGYYPGTIFLLYLVKEDDTMKIEVEVHEENIEMFKEVMMEYRFDQRPTEHIVNYQVPEWQKEAVRHTIATTRLEDYIPMEEVFAHLDKVARETE